MALAYAVQQLTAAVRLLAIGSAFPDQRLQQVWADQVANLRTSVYLPEHLNEQFKQMWARYAAPSDDPRSTALRDLPAEDQRAAVSASFDLAFATVVADAPKVNSPRPLPTIDEQPIPPGQDTGGWVRSAPLADRSPEQAECRHHGRLVVRPEGKARTALGRAAPLPPIAVSLGT
jgi:hypothetical protein